MSRTRPLLKVIESIYDAGADPGRWRHTLGAIAQLVDGRIAALTLYRQNEVVTEIMQGGDPSFSSESKINGMMDQNLWYQRRHRVPLNKAVFGEQLASPEEIKRTRVYSEMLKPLDVLRMCGIGFHGEGNIFGAMSILRREKDEPFGQAELDLVDAVAPHISRAARISSLLQG
jgi:hypothetical protein